MTISYFPVLLPDESIFSGIIRHHTLIGEPRCADYFAGLFGKYPVIRRFEDLSKISNRKTLETLAGRMQGGTEENIIKLLGKHTHSPISECLNNLMAMPAISCQHFDSWNYCAMCMLEDACSYGVSYWHRSHQVFGVKCCWKHLIQLSTADSGRALPSHFYKKAVDSIPAPAASVAQIRYSRMIYDLLSGVRFSFAPNNIPSIIDYRLWKSGMIRNENSLSRFLARSSSIFYLENSKVNSRFFSYPLFLLSCLAQLFENVSEIEDFARCGVLESTQMDPSTFRRYFPGTNWKWAYRNRVMQLSSEVPDEERYWLSKYDGLWMRERECLEKRRDWNGIYSQNLRTTYILRY